MGLFEDLITSTSAKSSPTFKQRIEALTSISALEVSASVVSLVSKTGGMLLFEGSGTIIESAHVNGIYVSTILTSASILRSFRETATVPNDIKVDVFLSDGQLFEGKVSFYDFHYNIATIKIDSCASLPTAIIRYLDDSISIDPKLCCSTEDDVRSAPFQIYHPHSEKFKLSPGDVVVGIGRFPVEPHNLMFGYGKFSADCCKFDCMELFRANFKSLKCGIGGPLVNLNGEVVGVMFYHGECTPFLPINIVSKCMEHFERDRTFCRPWLGMKATNLYATTIGNMEIIMQKFPNIFKGVIVEQVSQGSPADCAGILPDDVIIECSGNSVEGFLEFVGMLFDKAGSKERTIELVVLRGKTGARLNLSVALDEVTSDRFYSWPIPKPRPGSRLWIAQREREKSEKKKKKRSSVPVQGAVLHAQLEREKSEKKKKKRSLAPVQGAVLQGCSEKKKGKKSRSID